MPVTRIAVGVRADGTSLRLRYRLTGALDALAIPAFAGPRRGHDLWTHLCFEAFVKAEGARSYHEFNFSPSGEWAVYRLSDYREGFAGAEAAKPTEISVAEESGRLQLTATIDLASLPELREAQVLWLGLSTVIEDAQGRLGYWALAHPGAAPDFHHPGAFVLRLPAPEPTR